jgi:hypothetical protein
MTVLKCHYKIYSENAHKIIKILLFRRSNYTITVFCYLVEYTMLKVQNYFQKYAKNNNYNEKEIKTMERTYV